MVAWGGANKPRVHFGLFGPVSTQLASQAQAPARPAVHLRHPDRDAAHLSTKRTQQLQLHAAMSLALGTGAWNSRDPADSEGTEWREGRGHRTGAHSYMLITREAPEVKRKTF